jgi:nucleoside-diphosphate-sugar epimerase
VGGKTAAVTGATGFLGRHLVKRLAEDGWTVRILTRRDVLCAEWRNITPQIVIGDVRDPAALHRLCAGADLLVHAAGLIKAPSRAAFDAVNAEAARQGALAARAAGARMILISSLAAREPTLSDYAASKRAGEDAAQAVLGEKLTIVRPPAIYGPGDRETLALFAAAQDGPFLPVFGTAARLCLIHVEDAAAQIAAACAAPKAGTFALSDARREGYGWAEIMTAAGQAAGRRPRLIALPHWTIRLAAHMCAFLTGGRAIFGPGKARELLHPNWSVAGDAVLNDPPPRYGLTEGFAQTMEWYRSNGWLIRQAV